MTRIIFSCVSSKNVSVYLTYNFEGGSNNLSYLISHSLLTELSHKEDGGKCHGVLKLCYFLTSEYL